MASSPSTQFADPRIVPDDGAAPARARRARRWGSIARVTAMLLAVAMIVAADRLLRARQDLVAVIASHDAPSLMPFSDYLGERIGRRNEWFALLAKRGEAQSRHDAGAIIAADYELAKFVSSNLSSDDARRRDFLLDIVNNFGQDPRATTAYLELFDSDWAAKLRRDYPAYIDALLGIAARQPAAPLAPNDPKAATNPDGSPGTGLLINLAGVLRKRGETSLERRVLRQIRAAEPSVNPITVAPMRRLIELLPASDPDRRRISADIDAFDHRRDALLASSEWYRGFLEAAAAKDIDAMRRLRAQAPSPTDIYAASADAQLIRQLLWRGQFDEADRLRIALADRKTDDVPDPRMMMAMLPHLDPRPGRPQPPPPLPDAQSVRVQTWRGLLLSHRFAEADALAARAFGGNPDARDAVAAETRIARGQAPDASPLAMLQPVDSSSAQVPPEIRGRPHVAHATLSLSPIGSAVPAEIHAHADVWVSDTLAVIDFDADEPRPGFPPAARFTPRDSTVYKDACVELFFNPDRWFDFYDQLDVGARGAAIFDARMIGGGLPGSGFTADTSYTMDVKATPTARPGGWGLHIVVPRAQMIAPAQSVARFNVRRFRFVEVNKQPVLQVYSWAPMPDGSHHPERFGWIVLPKDFARAPENGNHR